MTFLQKIPRLGITTAAGELAAKLVESRAVPRNAAEDALHIAVAAAHGVDYLLTLELQTHCERGNEASHRRRVQGGRLRATGDLHAGGADE
jgi:hypothetical protein